MSLVDRRTTIKPVEYPEMIKYKEAIQHAYWLHSEFNFTEDIQDYHTHVSPAEKNAIKNTMLAIAQIEIAVKTFWSKLYDWFPKPEISGVGIVFGESEERHQAAYSHLLELLGLNDEFEKVNDIPAIRDRLKFLDKYLTIPEEKNYKKYVRTLLLFSLFTEHISLFSQFLVMKSFQKERNIFKSVSNVIDATCQEEQLHGKFGIYLTQLLQKEYPEWYDEEFETKIIEACQKAFKAEQKMLDWIFEAGELEFLPRKTIEEFIKDRFNRDLLEVGIQSVFEVDEAALKQVSWFDEETLAGKHVDFFHKRPSNYSLRNKAISQDDLF